MPYRFRMRRAAHVLERIGLAMAGASSGLLVGAHVGSSIALLTSWIFLVVMMTSGAIGFYLGIDTPPLPLHAHDETPAQGGMFGNMDATEFLSAVGTFLTAATAFVSVCVIVYRGDPHLFWTIIIMLGWVTGVMMQIIAGAVARTRE
jgi:hypothetical protein